MLARYLLVARLITLPNRLRATSFSTKSSISEADEGERKSTTGEGGKPQKEGRKLETVDKEESQWSKFQRNSTSIATAVALTSAIAFATAFVVHSNYRISILEAKLEAESNKLEAVIAG
jgi:hypothetical protein